MGSSLSTAQVKFCEDLLYLLKRNGHPVSESEVELLVKTIGEICPWVPKEGTKDLASWERIGLEFMANPKIGIPVQLVWSKVRNCFQQIAPRNVLLNGTVNLGNTAFNSAPVLPLAVVPFSAPSQQPVQAPLSYTHSPLSNLSLPDSLPPVPVQQTPSAFQAPPRTAPPPVAQQSSQAFYQPAISSQQQPRTSLQATVPLPPSQAALLPAIQQQQQQAAFLPANPAALQAALKPAAPVLQQADFQSTAIQASMQAAQQQFTNPSAPPMPMQIPRQEQSQTMMIQMPGLAVQSQQPYAPTSSQPSCLHPTSSQPSCLHSQPSSRHPDVKDSLAPSSGSSFGKHQEDLNSLMPPTDPTAMQPICRTQALEAALGQIDFSADPMHIFPVIRANGGQPARYQAIPFETLRELRKAIRENGLQAPYTRSLLEGLSTSRLLPSDWKLILRTFLSPTDALLCLQEWKEVAARRATPLATEDMLTGSGHYSNLNQQLAIPDAALVTIADIVVKAWRRLPNRTDASSVSGFAAVRQGPKEPYGDFVDRLIVAVERQIEDRHARNMLTKQLAFENANDDCKNALTAVAARPDATLTEMLRVCQNVGTHSYKAQLLAAAVQMPRQDSSTPVKKCYGCGGDGHFRSQCTTTPRPSAKPPERCPICQKGFHWANDCRLNPQNTSPTSSPVQGNGSAGRAPAPVKQ